MGITLGAQAQYPHEMNTTAKLLLLTGFILLNTVTSSYAAGVEIIAHRGASYDAPENTMASIHLAWKQGADAVEIDVMQSRDGQIVLFHDKGLKRLAGVAGKLVDKNYAELAKLDVGKWKAAQWSGERIPLLSDVLATIPDNKRMFVELKTGPEIVPELKRVIAAAGKKPAQIIFIAFNYDTCVRTKKELPQHQVAHISRYRREGKETEPTPSIASLVKGAKAGNLDGLDLDGNGPVGKNEATQIKAAGLGYYVWTINDAQRARQLIQDGVDGITTDRPAWLREQLAN